MLKGGGDLVHLDQVVNCLGRGFADRLHRSVQAGESLTDRNQSVLFTLHALFSHAGQTRSRRAGGVTERTDWAQQLDGELDEVRQELAAIRGPLAYRVSKRIGIMPARAAAPAVQGSSSTDEDVPNSA